MKKRFILKKEKKRNKKIIFICAFFTIIFILFKYLDTNIHNVNNKKIVNFILNQTIDKNNKKSINITKTFLKKIYNNPVNYLTTTKSNLIDLNKQKTKKVNKSIENTPQIYIYNTHQTEEYAASSFIEYSVKPTVMMVDYILEEIFNSNNLNTLVEENSIKEILNSNNWKYSYSYAASRQLMEKKKQENPSLKYFIDVHRDSLSKDKTTITIGDKDYAKTLFIIGLENPNYQENLNFTIKINDCLNDKYPQLSKGIYKKEGAGVNGVYNQDFSPYTILIEVGGYENTTTEVMNTTIAFSTCFMEVITNIETKTDS